MAARRKDSSARSSKKSATTRRDFLQVAGVVAAASVISDGYGSNWIRQFDNNANWVRTFGGTGSEPGQFKTPHGLWLDDRPDRVPTLVVADRATARLQYLSLDGQHIGFVTQDSEGRPGLTSDVAALKSPVSFPAHFDIRGDMCWFPICMPE